MNICGKINGECAVGFKGRKGRFRGLKIQLWVLISLFFSV